MGRADSSGNRVTTNRVIKVVGPPLATGSVMATLGQFQLRVAGIPGVSYTIQVSSNLTNWMDYIQCGDWAGRGNLL